MLENWIYIGNDLGKNGTTIRVPKIATMYPNAESQLTEAIEQQGFSNSYQISQDPRVIPQRRWLRRYFIDELPQVFYNVFLKRNMSLVGVRPKSEKYWDFYPRTHKKRSLQHKPGFLGVTKYDPSRTALQCERRYLAEKKLHPFCTDIKYALVIIYNILTRKAKGE